MTSAKDLVLKPLGARPANKFMRANHYSGKVVNNSKIHIGVFLRGRLEGVMQFGPSLDKSKTIGFVTGTRWDQFLELNRLAFTDRLPRNSESRAIAVACRLLRAHAPHIKWILSYADATQCGDGTIYRAAGFLLTGIKENHNLARIAGRVIHKMTLESNPARKLPWLGGRTYFDVTGGKYDWRAFLVATDGVALPGFQIRYIKFLDPSWYDRLAVPEIPYEKIGEIGASMYRGERQHAPEASSDAPVIQTGEDGAAPIPALQ